MHTRLLCEGAKVGALYVPPFALVPGSCVCLHLPSPITDDTERLARALTGREVVRGIHIESRVLSAVLWDLPYPGRFLRIFYRPRIESWLRSLRIPPSKITGILARHGWTNKTRLEQLPGTPKTLLVLEAAWAQNAEALVFTTMGLDPLGEMRVNEAVAQRLDDCPAVYLSTQYTCNGELGRRCFKPGICIEAVAADSLALASG
jgi:hypothetical protein